MGICRRDFGKCALGGLAATLFGAPPRAKLLVIVLLEQFRPDYLDIVRPLLVPGGFRRLSEKGAYFPNCLHEASTFSSTAIATLATGAWPAQHGIVADRWYEQGIKRTLAPSDEALQATTLVAQIAAEPEARITVISLDRAHGGLFAGPRDAGRFWLNDAGQFKTSGDVPDWLGAFNAQWGADSVRNGGWVALGAGRDAPPLRILTYTPE